MRLKPSLIASALLVGLSLVLTSCSSGGGTTTDSTPTSVTGAASLSGTTASSTDTVTDASAMLFASQADTTTVDETIKATLIVDQNSDGNYGDSKDMTYTATVMTDGAFDFGKIAVPAGGSYNAQLTVKKEGYAAFTRVVTLSDGQNISLTAEATLAPVQIEVVSLPAANDPARKSSFLTFGLLKSSAGVKSYAKIMSLSELNAMATDPSFGANSMSQSVIPLATFPADVSVVNAEMRAFDPTDPQDSKLFPGEYKGVGKSSGTSATTDPMQLVSVAFDLVSLTDQNGAPITLDKTKLAPSKLSTKAIDYATCLQTKTRYVGADQKALIEQYGDDDTSTPEFEVPMWYYNNTTGMWQYLGEAEYDATNSQVTMCITENWGQYLNLDYAFALEQPQTICVDAKYSDGAVIKNMTLSAKKDTTYDYQYLNEEGKATLGLTAGGSLGDYEIAYSGSVNGWTNTVVDHSLITASSVTGCNYDLHITVENPYSASLSVKALKIDGTVAKNEYVTVRSSNYSDYFHQYVQLDANGEGTVAVKPNVNYTVSYSAKSVVANINGTVVLPETADSGKYATVEVQDANSAPQVSLYFDRGSLSDKATEARFTVNARDENGDAITLSSITLNTTTLKAGTDYTVVNEYKTTSHHYMYAILNLESATVKAIVPSSLAAGNYTLRATFSDGKASTVGSASLSVTANRAPQISSLYLYKDNRYFDINRKLDAGTYTIYLYAHDPDGDATTTTYSLDGGTASESNSIAFTDGAHTVTVVVSDGVLSTSKTINVWVGNRRPTVGMATASKYLVDINSANKTFTLTAYAYDDDGDTLTVKAKANTGEEYTLAAQGNNKYLSAPIARTKAEIVNFAVTASDANQTSTARGVQVEIIAGNQAPIFTTELTNAQYNVGTSKTFTCQATDPEGLALTYAWKLGDATQSATGETFATTFSTKGSYVVSCSVTDSAGNVATSSATITVIDPTSTATLTLRTGVTGLIAAVHNASTYAVISQTNTDANGNAAFTISGSDRVTFSLSRGPTFVVPNTTLVEDLFAQAVYGAQMNCQYLQGDARPAACDTFDFCAQTNATSLPNWVIDLAQYYQTEKYSAASVDTNSDGSVSSAEILVAVLANADTNKNGKIEQSELDGSTSINSEVFVNVPVGDYYISLGEEDNYQEQMSGCSGQYALQISGFTANEYVNFQTSGSAYFYGYGMADANGVAKATTGYLMPQSDGLYSTLVKLQDPTTGANSFYFYKDKTATQMASISLNKGDFTALSTQSVTLNGTEDNSIGVTPTYKGLGYSSLIGGDYYSATRTISLLSGMSYLLNGSSYTTDTTTGASVNRYHYGYYGDGTLQSSYNAADYAHLNATYTPSLTGITFSGSDLSLINVIEVDYNAYAENAQMNVKFNFTVAPTALTMPNLATIMPAGIKEYVIASPTSGYIFVGAHEFKGVSEAEFIAAVTGANADNAFMLLEQNGVRGFDSELSLTSQVAAPSRVAKAPAVKALAPKRVINPFIMELNTARILTR